MSSQASYREELDYIADYGREDWVGMSALTPVAVADAGKGANFETQLDTLLNLVGDLIDRGVLPGDLFDEEPGFIAWSGDKRQLVARLSDEVRALGYLPDSGEVCWFHTPET